MIFFHSMNFFCFGWTILGSNRGREKKFFSSSKYPRPLYVPASLLFNRSHSYLPEQRFWVVVLTNYVQLEARLRISGAIRLWKNFTVLPIPFTPILCVWIICQ